MQTILLTAAAVFVVAGCASTHPREIATFAARRCAVSPSAFAKVYELGVRVRDKGIPKKRVIARYNSLPASEKPLPPQVAKVIFPSFVDDIYRGVPRDQARRHLVDNCLDAVARYQRAQIDKRKQKTRS